MNLAKNFAAKRFLKLNEVVVYARSHQAAAAPVCEVARGIHSSSGGYRKVSWSVVERNLMAKKSVKVNIRKARRALFSY